ncbi:MAG: hypothetical protein PG981_001375 [Wolbachia endosymbiont of Ctenocephalides orientis wCori]|nr:MAG: hypothetical protein PG981_001375 [Wolbachia endosymbiont of Ctenocephalides orientis wCori]
MQGLRQPLIICQQIGLRSGEYVGDRVNVILLPKKSKFHSFEQAPLFNTRLIPSKSSLIITYFLLLISPFKLNIFLRKTLSLA